MNGSEVVRRIAVVLRAIGVLVLVLGVIGSANESASAHVLPIAVATAIAAVPFFVVAWIVDGLNHGARR